MSEMKHTPGPKTPFRYECYGDSDGELVGYDHFVFDANGDEISHAPDEKTGRLFAAAPDLLAACLAVVASRSGDVGDVIRAMDMAEDAIRKATSGT